MPRTAIAALPAALLFWPLATVSGCRALPAVAHDRAALARADEGETALRVRALSDADIPHLARFSRLRSLDFFGGYGFEDCGLTDAGLAELASLELPELEYLIVGACPGVTDAGLEQVARIRTLKWFSAAGCVRLSDCGVEWLKGLDLEGLDLRGCIRLTDDALRHLAAMSSLRIVLLGGCELLSEEGIEELCAALPDCAVVKDDYEWQLREPLPSFEEPARAVTAPERS